ncbi:hypothetical protein SAMN05216490_3751 [Mucilaginibacter mallensis]|uniref:Uncharacterized protein n=1 Tax=Mucilaginibacter mallensis TaxID=652787 RepID=A0A1H2AVI7_MUCMA|nr:hypothetical protein SAMN05216490_3751 [Mucilaginibacter mallensis]
MSIKPLFTNDLKTNLSCLLLYNKTLRYEKKTHKHNIAYSHAGHVMYKLCPKAYCTATRATTTGRTVINTKAFIARTIKAFLFPAFGRLKRVSY